MSELLMHPMGGGTGSDDVTATAANVLSGKTAVTSDSDDEAIEGTMPNNGAMDVTLTPGGNGSTSQAVAGGYYSGGTITADGSAAYSAGHSQGVTDADNRVNTSSASYNSGYANGYANGYNTVAFETVTGAGVGWSKTYPGTVLAAGITYANQIYYSWDNGDMEIHAWCSTSGNTVSVTANGDTGSGNNKLKSASFNLVVAYRTA